MAVRITSPRAGLDEIINRREPHIFYAQERVIGPIPLAQINEAWPLTIGEWLPRIGSPDTICGRLKHIEITEKKECYLTIGPPWHLMRHIRKVEAMRDE